jgi:putative transposase
VAQRGRKYGREERRVIRSLVDEAMAQGARQEAVCKRLGISQRTLQRWLLSPDDGRHGPSSEPANKLSEGERQLVVAAANSPEFRDVSPKQIVPRLADQGQYLGSESTFYRVLKGAKLMAHRGRAKAPVPRPKPELVASGPLQVWTWDISYLRTSVRGTFFYLYMVVDIFSRRIVGWAVHEEESSALAATLIERAWLASGSPKGLKLHSDNGGPMKGCTLLSMLQSLGMSASFSRPRVSDDNPYSEALFRTVKYSAMFPEKPFESIEAARSWVAGFVDWYNTTHRHSAIRFVTPDQRHFGQEAELLEKRAALYELARRRNPNRWSHQSRNWSPAPAVRLGQVHLRPSTKEAVLH